MKNGQSSKVHSRSMMHQRDVPTKEKQRGVLDQAVTKNLAVLRKKASLSQNELAAKTGVSVSYVSMLECGKRSPPLSTLWALAKALRVEPEALLRRA